MSKLVGKWPTFASEGSEISFVFDGDSIGDDFVPTVSSLVSPQLGLAAVPPIEIRL